MPKLLFTSGFLLFLSLHLQGQQGQVSIEEDPQIKNLLAIYKDA